MKISDYMYLYGRSIGYRILFKIADQPNVDAGVFTFDDLNSTPAVAAKDVLYSSSVIDGLLTVVV